jgi:hypothetical protein
MKKFFFTIALALTGVSLFAQEKTAPRSEFTIELSAPSLEVKAGESKEVAITLNRSKAYAKSKAILGISSGLPQGVTVTFEPAEGVIESSVAKVTVAESVKAGTYTIIFNSIMQQKSKGKMLKLVVGDGAAQISLNQ